MTLNTSNHDQNLTTPASVDNMARPASLEIYTKYLRQTSGAFLGPDFRNRLENPSDNEPLGFLRRHVALVALSMLEQAWVEHDKILKKDMLFATLEPKIMEAIAAKFRETRSAKAIGEPGLPFNIDELVEGISSALSSFIPKPLSAERGAISLKEFQIYFIRNLVLIFLLTLFLAACSGQNIESVTPTLVPTASPDVTLAVKATQTAEAEPTVTPEPAPLTATPEIIPDGVLTLNDNIGNKYYGTYADNFLTINTMPGHTVISIDMVRGIVSWSGADGTTSQATLQYSGSDDIVGIDAGGTFLQFIDLSAGEFQISGVLTGFQPQGDFNPETMPNVTLTGEFPTEFINAARLLPQQKVESDSAPEVITVDNYYGFGEATLTTLNVQELDQATLDSLLAELAEVEYFNQPYELPDGSLSGNRVTLNNLVLKGFEVSQVVFETPPTVGGYEFKGPITIVSFKFAYNFGGTTHTITVESTGGSPNLEPIVEGSVSMTQFPDIPTDDGLIENAFAVGDGVNLTLNFPNAKSSAGTSLGTQFVLSHLQRFESDQSFATDPDQLRLLLERAFMLEGTDFITVGDLATANLDLNSTEVLITSLQKTGGVNAGN